ncbi:hypothetical protein [Virgisporangium aurantiacum]|nr:hypothetical protein [Virgisporangium aurantiacum]
MSDLDRLADGCALLSRAQTLAGWVGAGRPVTPKDVLRPGEVSDVAAALGVEVPATVRSAADVGDAPVEDWFPDCGRDPTPFDVAEINRHLAGEDGPVGS